MQQRNFTVEEKQQIRQDYERLGSSLKAAALWNCSYKTILLAVRQAGGAVRPKHAVGAEAPQWRGGRLVGPKGYVLVHVPGSSPLSAMRDKKGYVPEHRLVVAQHLCRPLTAEETVHHINGDRQDNRIENLQLRSGSHGEGQVRRCADCGSHNVVAVAL